MVGLMLFNRVCFSISLFFGLFVCGLAPTNAVESQLESPKIITTGPWSYRLTLTANANKAIIWRLWEDVENWKSFDIIVKYSYLNEPGVFQTGATGYVKTSSAPKTRFELLAVNHGHSFTESLLLTK